jgi:hypothetical protein
LDQSSISLPSSSIFRQMNQWPIYTISCDQDLVSQNAAELLRTEHTITNHSIIPGNTSCYLYTPSLFIIAILDYFEAWEQDYPTTTDDTYDVFQDYFFTEDKTDSNRCGNTYISEMFPI